MFIVKFEDENSF